MPPRMTVRRSHAVVVVTRTCARARRGLAPASTSLRQAWTPPERPRWSLASARRRLKRCARHHPASADVACGQRRQSLVARLRRAALSRSGRPQRSVVARRSRKAKRNRTSRRRHARRRPHVTQPIDRPFVAVAGQANSPSVPNLCANDARGPQAPRAHAVLRRAIGPLTRRWPRARRQCDRVAQTRRCRCADGLVRRVRSHAIAGGVQKAPKRTVSHVEASARRLMPLRPVRTPSSRRLLT